MKTLKVTILTLATLIALSLALTSWVLYNPRQSFEIAEKYFFPPDLKITWKKWNLKTKHLSGFDFFIDWQIDDLLIEKQNPRYRIPLDKIRLKASLELLRKRILIENLEVIAQSEIDFKLSKENDQTTQLNKNIFQLFQSMTLSLKNLQKKIEYQKIDIQIGKLTLKNKTPHPLILNFKINSTEASPVIYFDATITRENEDPYSAFINGQFNPELLNTESSFLNAELGFEGFKLNLKQNLNAQLTDQIARFNLQGPVQLNSEKNSLTASAQTLILVDEKSVSLKLKADISGLPGPLKKVKDFELMFNTPLEESVFWSDRFSTFEIVAPIELKLVQSITKEKLQKSCNCEFPLTLTAKASGKVALAKLTQESPDKATVVDAQISLENIKNKLYSLDLRSALKVEKIKDQWIFLPVLDCRASIYDFKSLAPVFDAYKIMIPAPFDILNGEVHFLAQGPINRDHTGSKFPAKFEVDLRSNRQLVRLQNDASVLISPDFKKIHVETSVQVKDFQIELPPLSPVGGKPRITKDKRILKIPPAKQAKSTFEMSFDIQVDTVKPGAIRFLSEFFKPHMPLTLKFHFDSTTGNKGFIQTEPFNIVYIRRTVSVEKMRLDLDHADESIVPVDGRFRVKQTHYTIFIDVKGHAKNPHITMTSEPELPQNEIISVLLYDRVSGELASADAETAGGVQAAIADRAIGLFGLWAFASTPIRSFSYNPVTKVYTATLALGGDVTAAIGTTWESTAQLELRKRVSRRWMLTARWTAASDEEGQNTEIVLQWERRF